MTIYGWDMSHYDAPGLGSAITDGITFVTHKAGGDSNSGDDELDNWWSGVRILPERVVLGAYWVPRPDLHSSPSGEADRFLSTLDARCPGWRDRDAFILQVDAEEWNQDPATKPSKAYLKTLCDRLVYRTDGAYRPVVYASAGQYGSSLTGLGYPLWNARYPYSVAEGFKAAYARAGGDSGKGWGSYSGQTPVIWQYTSSAVIGGQTTSDANAFRGTVQDLKELVTPMANLSQEDRNWISAEIAKQVKASLPAILDVVIGDVARPARDIGDRERDDAKLRGYLVGDAKDTANAAIPDSAPIARIVAAADAILADQTPA